ncbi:hypothetical protein PcPA57_04890 [Pasteurella canis]|uniref:DUF2167 domain-containing protein n=1 Tax=Pasteurella canis TaxID=753 RepID=UPI001E41604D|nr:DUF2167 domain-containing protein [Pasteurella canis]GJJ79769.1 hypothetical protein PcPA57_04890 [Pasteurella canis]
MFSSLRQIFTKLIVLFFLIFSVNTIAVAGTADSEEKLDKIEELLHFRGIEGPLKFPFPGGFFNLTSDMLFLPGLYADQFMELIGNHSNIGRLAVVIKKDNPSWVFDIVYSDIGYISDKEAKTWDVDALFEKQLKGDKERNEIRRQKGMPEIETLGWVKKPVYDEKKHHLGWAINLKPIGPNVREETGNIVNYKTYILSRRGYIEVSFLSGESEFEAEKAIAEELLEGIHFYEGEGYEDFIPKQDKVAWFGISTLISGTYGRFAEREEFLLIFVIIIIGGILFAVVAFKRFLERKALVQLNGNDILE